MTDSDEGKDARFVLPIYPRAYHVLHCNSCWREFKDGETVWQFQVFAPSYVYLCGSCAKVVPYIPDFNPNGSKEPAQVNWSWLWIRVIVLKRDNYACRLNERPDAPLKDHLFDTEVHHIVPRKDGGTNNFENLITLCEGCHKATFKNGYGGIPRKEQAQLLLTPMPSEGRWAFPTTPKIKVAVESPTKDRSEKP